MFFGMVESILCWFVEQIVGVVETSNLLSLVHQTRNRMVQSRKPDS